MISIRLNALVISAMWAISAAAPPPASAAPATAWEMVPSESRIAFSGTHAGLPFKGAFGKFEAAIVFDPAQLDASHAEVAVDLSSAATGDATRDKTLPTADWFNVAKTPRGIFLTHGFKNVGGDRYEAQGDVEIRGVKVPVTLAFEAKIEGDTLRVSGTAELKRLDFGIGKASDAAGEWVALTIPIEVTVVAKRK
jgi:cytochrome b561